MKSATKADAYMVKYGSVVCVLQVEVACTFMNRIANLGGDRGTQL